MIFDLISVPRLTVPRPILGLRVHEEVNTTTYPQPDLDTAIEWALYQQRSILTQIPKCFSTLMEAVS